MTTSYTEDVDILINYLGMSSYYVGDVVILR